TKIVNTTVWARWRRCALVARMGRISSIAAPVVPMKLASSPPTARKAVLVRGVAARSPRRTIPPDTVNSASSSTMNCTYSMRAWATSSGCEASSRPIATGTPGTSGKTAMPSSISTNGIRVQTGKSIADHITFEVRTVRISRAPASGPPVGGADPHTDARGGERESHVGPFAASMTGERRSPSVPTRLPGSPRSVSHGPRRPGRGCPADGPGTARCSARRRCSSGACPVPSPPVREDDPVPSPSAPRRRPFAQLDVFADRPQRGNPLAVVLDAEDLTEEDMQRLARWTNLSETTFLLPPTVPGADYRVRIFTGSEELPFAGHPTLGTARAWLEAGGEPAGEQIVQECAAGLIPVRRDGDRLAFAAPPLRRSGPL